MNTRRQFSRYGFGGALLAVVVAGAVVGCGSMMPATSKPAASAPSASTPAAPAPSASAPVPEASNMVAFTTQLRGANEVPPVVSPGSGTVDAAFNKSTMQLKWKVSFSGMTGPATMAHFHGPAAVGANSGVALGWTNPITSGMEGSAALTAAQAADLMDGKWYANIHSAAFPGGELRGQMAVRN